MISVMAIMEAASTTGTAVGSGMVVALGTEALSAAGATRVSEGPAWVAVVTQVLEVTLVTGAVLVVAAPWPAREASAAEVIRRFGTTMLTVRAVSSVRPLDLALPLLGLTPKGHRATQPRRLPVRASIGGAAELRVG